jgi:predicted nucleotidyltransferase
LTEAKNILQTVSEMGTIALIMSTDTQTQGLLEALFGKTRRSILALLFSHTEESFHLRKILRLAGISPGAGQRELKRLSDAGVILRTVKENQVLFQANPQCPIFEELKSLITKTAGVVDALRAALGPLSGRISMALLYGSLARGKAVRDSDIDLLVVGEVSFEDIVGNVARAQDLLRREINPMVMSLEEYLDRRSREDHFLDAILKSPYIPVIGDPRELVRVAQKRLAH